MTQGSVLSLNSFNHFHPSRIPHALELLVLNTSQGCRCTYYCAYSSNVVLHVKVGVQSHMSNGEFSEEKEEE